METFLSRITYGIEGPKPGFIWCSTAKLMTSFRSCFLAITANASACAALYEICF